MRQPTPIILINSLHAVRGGLTRAVITRANVLAEKYKRVYIYTFLYQQHLQADIETLRKTGALSKKVTVVNMFDDLKPHKHTRPKAKQTSKDRNAYAIFKDNNQQNNPSYRYYQHGLYAMYKRYNPSGELMFIDHMNHARHRTSREEYDSNQYLSRQRHMDITNNKPRLDRYFDNKGACYLTIWVNSDTQKETRTMLFAKDNAEYASLDDLKAAWLNQKLKAVSNPVIMIDQRHMDEMVINLDQQNVKKVAVLHNNHLDKPFTSDANIKRSYQTLLNNMEEFDKLVFLTEEQKQDVQTRFGSDNNQLTVISHAAKKSPDNKTSDYTPFLAVSLARYQKQKRLDEAIRAFKYVVDELPQAQYHIYGHGKEKEKLTQLIADLGLEKHVKLKGFAHDSSAVLRSSACSILTSDYEGFGMVLTESLANGTPVVSYDVKYGPKDIVRDGVDGYLVEQGDKRALADKIINIMKDDELRQSLSENAKRVVERYSFNQYKNNWHTLFQTL